MISQIRKMNTQSKNKKIKNLFVVDWKNTPSQEMDNLLNKSNLLGYEWSFYNCHTNDNADRGAVNRYISYFIAAIHILKNKKNMITL